MIMKEGTNDESTKTFLVSEDACSPVAAKVLQAKELPCNRTQKTSLK